jgi:hypothetical protein
VLTVFRHFFVFAAINLVIFFALAPAGGAGAEQLPGNNPQASGMEQIIVVVIDGLEEKALEKGWAPNIDSLCQSGVRVQDVQGTLPDGTRPAATTVLTGYEPARHGYIDTGDSVRVDSLIDQAEDKGYKSAIFDGSGGALEGLGKRCSYFKDKYQGKDRLVMDMAINELGKKKFFLSIILLPQLKVSLEKDGAGSKEFRDAVTDSDNQVGRLVHFLNQSGQYAKTLLVLTGTSGVPPIILNGPGVKSSAVVPAAGVVDIAPTVEKLAGLPGGRCSGLILWDALQPAAEQNESYLLAQRVNNLGKAYNEARRDIDRSQEEKIAVERGQARMAAEKNLILKEIGRRDQQIEGLKLKIKIMKWAGLVLLIFLLAGYLYQYRYLKKKFLMFN